MDHDSYISRLNTYYMGQIQNSKRRFSLTSEVGLAILRRSRGIVWLCIASDCEKGQILTESQPL